MNRRDFNKTLGSAAALATFGIFTGSQQKGGFIMTVNGEIPSVQMGTTLSHEHVLVDFVGADKVSPDRYNIDEAYQKVLPYLEEVKKLGCKTFVECTPNYLGRNVTLLRRLAEASNLQILTNTGYYGARKGVFLPKHVTHETPKQLARRWITEFELGVDDTGIRPGFIKIGVDGGRLPTYNRKIAEAAAHTHLATGLTIAAHTGDAQAAFEELDIIQKAGAAPNAFIWVHAQNQGAENHVRAAKMGAWVEIDGVSLQNYEDYATQVDTLKKAGYLHKVLVSCDAGWYHVGEPQGGNYRSHAITLQELPTALQQLGFSEKDIDQLLVRNPAEAFSIRIRKV